MTNVMVEVGGIAPPSGHGLAQTSTIIVQLLISPQQLRGTGYADGYPGKFLGPYTPGRAVRTQPAAVASDK